MNEPGGSATGVVLTCQHCSQEIEASEDLLGQTVHCPACSGSLLVEHPNAVRSAHKPPKARAQLRVKPGVQVKRGDDGPVADAEIENEIWSARPTAKAFLGEIIAGCLLAPIGIGLVLLVAVWYKTQSLQYRLTNERLFVQRGLIAKNLEEVELYRVKDQTLRQGILQRILGFGAVVVYSTDDSTPTLSLIGINRPAQVKESIRSAVRLARQKAGVRFAEFAQS